MVEPAIPDRQLAESLQGIAQRLQQIDKQMREQERRLEQILADGQIAVRNVGKG